MLGNFLCAFSKHWKGLEKKFQGLETSAFFGRSESVEWALERHEKHSILPFAPAHVLQSARQ